MKQNHLEAIKWVQEVHVLCIVVCIIKKTKMDRHTAVVAAFCCIFLHSLGADPPAS